MVAGCNRAYGCRTRRSATMMPASGDPRCARRGPRHRCDGCRGLDAADVRSRTPARRPHRHRWRHAGARLVALRTTSTPGEWSCSCCSATCCAPSARAAVERDALEVALPFRHRDQRALVVIVECESEAEAEELADGIYAAERETWRRRHSEAAGPAAARRSRRRGGTSGAEARRHRVPHSAPPRSDRAIGAAPRSRCLVTDRRPPARRAEPVERTTLAHLHGEMPEQRRGRHRVPGAIPAAAAADRIPPRRRAHTAHRGPHRRRARPHRHDRAAWLPPGRRPRRGPS